MLPDEYKKSVEDQLESATWSAGRGYSGASWNLQNWKEGMAEERIQEAVDDMFEQMGYGANKAFAEAGIGELFDSFDLSTEEGFKKAQTAISAISSITTAIDEIKAPTSEAEQQAKAFVAQMDALGEAVKASGLNAAYADKMIGEYRTAYVDSYVKSLDEMFNPLSEIEQQAKSYKESIDSRVAALTTMSASEAQLAKVRGYTQKAIDSIVGSLDAAFFPLSDVEKQTKSTMELLTAYENALKTLGDTGNGLAKVDEARAKVQSDLLDKARAYVSTTPEVVSQAAAMNAEFDALREAMLLAGNATADLTELEQIRAQAVAALQAQYVRSFDQGLAQRYATLNGTSDAVSRAISQENELRETITKFGEDSAQVSQLLHIQAAENVAAAQAAVDSLQNQLNSLKQQALNSSTPRRRSRRLGKGSRNRSMTAGRSCGRRTLTRSVCSRREMRPSPSSTASTASRCRVIPKRLQNWHHPGIPCFPCSRKPPRTASNTPQGSGTSNKSSKTPNPSRESSFQKPRKATTRLNLSSRRNSQCSMRWATTTILSMRSTHRL